MLQSDVELSNIFRECLSRFPELVDDDIKIWASHSEGLSGAMGKVYGERAVILFVPDELWGYWTVLKCIIFHELSHLVNLYDPDSVFYERADDKSIELWKLLQKEGALKCEVVS